MNSGLFDKVAVNVYEYQLREMIKLNSEYGRLNNLLFPSVDNCHDRDYTVEQLVDLAIRNYIDHLKASCELAENLLSEPYPVDQ